MDNVVANALSCSANVFDTSPSHTFHDFFSTFPQMHGFDLYQPSPALSLAILYALLEGKIPACLLQRIKRQRGINAAFLGSFVTIDI